MKKPAACLFALALLGVVHAQPTDAGLQPMLGAELPLEAVFTDSEGRTGPLREHLGAQPALLVPGYYRCPDLCGVVMHGVLEALQKSAPPRSGYRVLRVSIDPTETSADARAQRTANLAYATFLDEPPASSPSSPSPSSPPSPALDLRLLTGPPASIEALAERSGFRYRRSEPRREGRNAGEATWTHPATVIVVTAGGRISNYLNGVPLDPAELRRALVQASGGRIGTFAERIALLCASLDLRQGPYSAAVWRGLQATALLTLVGLALLWWRLARRGGAA